MRWVRPIDKLLRTDGKEAFSGLALNSESAANHDARLISANVLSIFIEKKNDKSTLIR